MITTGCHSDSPATQKPNIIFFMADDLGYGEIGVQGQQKIHTPHIDALAKKGMRFTQHYSGAPVCAPARCILLTGLHAGHAYIRGNDEWRERGDVWDYAKAAHDASLEGQRPIPAHVVTLAEVLQDADYTTGMFGKWGLGAPGTEGDPVYQGFDYFYGYNCQRQAHNLYPPFLWDNLQKDTLDNELIAPRTKLDEGADAQDPASYARFTQRDYAPEKIHDRALSFLDAHSDEPFFLYYPSPLPHLPLQAPTTYVNEYRDQLGNEEVYIGDKGYFPTPYPRATYAAMISYLDRQLGELVQKLKDKGVYDNTIIFFTSDNGPTYTGGVDFDYFDSSTPFSNGYGRTKGFVYEGGIRVPMIVSWPGHIDEGSTSGHISAFYDIMPTIIDLTAIPADLKTDGISFVPALLGHDQEQHDFLYWEFPSYQGQQAVRMGDWKGIRKNIFKDSMDIELYNLKDDILEQHDIADQNKEIVQQIQDIMTSQHTPSAVDRFKIAQLGDQ